MNGYVYHFRDAVLPGNYFQAASMIPPDGDYVVFATADLECLELPNAAGLGVQCTLKGGGKKHETTVYFSGDDCKPNNRMPISLTIPAHTLGIALSVGDAAFIGPIELVCLATFPNAVKIRNVTLTAIGVDSVHTFE